MKIALDVFHHVRLAEPAEEIQEKFWRSFHFSIFLSPANFGLSASSFFALVSQTRVAPCPA
jgi:hypothetical protein